MDRMKGSNSAIVSAYRQHTPKSGALAGRAKDYLPSGIAHDVRYLHPYPIYTDHAKGGHKWDVDGNRYVDYFGGHGALLLGNAHPEITAAIQAAAEKGTHYGTGHELEVQWAEMICRMIPCAERVRFTSSGTEATHLAIRLARAFTGRPNIVRFRTNFHGWHDHMASGFVSHFDGSAPTGVLDEIAAHSLLLDPNDIEGARELLRSRDDIAGVILEPTGASFGMIPMAPGMLDLLREETRRNGSLLIFDEVVTGFRVAPGGAQAHYGVTPDLTSLGKIVAGGLPGAAVAGRKDVLDLLDFDRCEEAGLEKITHFGTFNGNPLTAAAAVAMLSIVEEGGACEQANRHAESLRSGLNGIFAKLGVPWAAYGEFSGFHIFTNTQQRAIDPLNFDPLAVPFSELKANPPALVEKFRLALMVHGVDINGWPGGITAAVHDDDDLAEALDAAEKALVMLQTEETLG